MARAHVEVSGRSDGFVQQATARTHHVQVDEPMESGGTDQAPTPTEYILTSLGACTSMTVSMYARRKGWPLESVHVTLEHEKVRKESADGTSRMVDTIERKVELRGPLDEAQRARLLEIANKCPMHLLLTNAVEVDTKLA